MPNSIPQLARRTARAFMDAVFPLKCLICKEPFISDSGFDKKKFVRALAEPGFVADAVKVFEQVVSPHVCAHCIKGFMPINSPLCIRCGASFVSREGEDRVCGDCIETASKISRIRAFGLYEGPLRELVHRLKYGGKISASRPLTLLLFVSFIKFWGKDAPGVDLIVPVPLHMKRFRKRGFNQAYLLVRGWASLCRIAGLSPKFSVAKELLVRHRYTESQTGFDRAKRAENVKGAFSPGPDARIRGKRIVLVDDVYTTGSTANACADVLVKHGALSVDLLTLARV